MIRRGRWGGFGRSISRNLRDNKDGFRCLAFRTVNSCFVDMFYLMDGNLSQERVICWFNIFFFLFFCLLLGMFSVSNTSFLKRFFFLQPYVCCFVQQRARRKAYIRGARTMILGFYTSLL